MHGPNCIAEGEEILVPKSWVLEVFNTGTKLTSVIHRDHKEVT